MKELLKSNVNTSSSLPFANFANVLAPEAYKISPVAVITDCGELVHSGAVAPELVCNPCSPVPFANFVKVVVLFA